MTNNNNQNQECNNHSDGVKNENVIVKHKKAKKNKKKKRFGFLYLFVVVFLIALVSLSYLVQYYSPDVDVAIGDKEDMPLNYSDFDYEIRPIDERLKWIQMEDDMPSVSIKKEKDTDYSYLFNKSENKKELKKRKNELTDRKAVNSSLSNEANQLEKEPLLLNDSILSHRNKIEEKELVKSITKVYIGTYESLDEAITVQHKVLATGLADAPFVKASNGKYIVQVGSFQDEERANNLISDLKSKGFSAKKKIEK